MKVQKRSPDPFFFDGDERGVLLIHGFTGSPAELRPMGDFFRQKGFTVCAPLLKGHGTMPEEMNETAWPDWWQSAVEGYKQLKACGCTRIYVAGLSMGGVLALRIAREFPVDAVIPMCAPMKFRDKRAYFAPLLYRFVPYIKRDGVKAPHIEEQIVPYDRTPVKSVASLGALIRDVRRSLGRIKAPALIVQAGEDETIDPRDAFLIFSRLGSARKEVKWYPKSSHIIVLDVEREQLFDDVLKFIEKVKGDEG